MNQLTATGKLYGNTVTLKRVSKSAAKKAYNEGNEIYFQSSNIYPFGMWQSVCPVLLERAQTTFEAICNEFSYYNCDSERGRYVHFYIAI